MNRLRDGLARIPLVKKGLQLVWESAGWWTVGWIVLLTLQGVLPAALVYLSKVLVDAVAESLSGGLSYENVQPLLLPAGLIAAIMIAERALSSVQAWVNTAQTELVQDHIKTMIHEKSVAVDFGFFEFPEFYDRLEQANSQAGSNSLALLTNIGGVVQSTVTLLAISGILIQYSLFLPVVLIASTLPALYVVVRYNRKYHDWWRETTAARRWAQYFNGLVTLRAIASEIRLYNTGKSFIEEYRRVRNQLRRERIALVREQAGATFVASILAAAVVAGTMVWMVRLALRGLATMGDLALFYQAFNRGQGLMRTLLSNAGQIYTNTLFLEHLFAFLDYENEVEEPESPLPIPGSLRKGLEFRDVTFAYPGSEVPALSRFNLFIPAGKIVAIVGANGAGKSTVTKLLCRLYDPQEGIVEFDRIDIRQFSIEDLRRQISIMFQVPVQYQATAEDNIRLGVEHTSRREVERAASGAGAHEFISNLPKGYDTLLGRLFTDGTELSGGQWQRIALARAFVRQAEVVILDEPTSAMDSWAENAWLKRFRRLVSGKTAIIITHRFTTAMQADVIHVMDGGRIVESGTHEELVRSGGLYAASWSEQMRAEGDLIETA